MRVSGIFDQSPHFRRFFITNNARQIGVARLAVRRFRLYAIESAIGSRDHGRRRGAGSLSNTKMGSRGVAGNAHPQTLLACFPRSASGRQAVLKHRRRSRANGPRKRILGSKVPQANRSERESDGRTPLFWCAIGFLSIIRSAHEDG